MSELIYIKRLEEDQIEEASGVAGRAFQDDPLFVYCCPDPIERKNMSNVACENMILAGILSGEVYITSNTIEGIAVWHPVGEINKISRNQSKEIIRRSRRVRREMNSDSLFMERYGIFTEIIVQFHNKYIDFPHWYLSIIGVDPAYQGKGYGSKLLKMKLAEIDEQKLPCYLHTENEKNIHFYEQFGFEVVDKAVIPNSELKAWAMIRKRK